VIDTTANPAKRGIPPMAGLMEFGLVIDITVAPRDDASRLRFNQRPVAYRTDDGPTCSMGEAPATDCR